VPAYANASGRSNVVSYDDSLADSIVVRFRRGKGPSNYVYTVASAGRAGVDELKRLAAAGLGLNRTITKRYKYAYARKW